MIHRFGTEDLVELLMEFPAVAIVGPRQVGKTTLAKLLAHQLEKDMVYVDLENPRDELKLQDPVLFFEANEDKCVVIDEIQRKKELFPILRSMIDKKRQPARFILLGSASPELIRDSSESLAGRIYYKELTPFHSIELPESYSSNELLLRGGFPNALLAASDKASFRWRESFIQTYVERDLPLLGLLLQPSEARRVLRMLVNLNGQLLNYASLAKSLGVTAPTVKRYVQFLEQAFLIELLEPFTGNTNKRISKSPKIYIRDTGIANYMLGILSFNDLLAHPKVGDLWEAFIVQQLAAILPSNVDRCFYRTHNGAEIDLILTFPTNEKIGIEVKWSAAPKVTAGTYEAMKDLKLEELYVVSPTSDSFFLQKSIQVINVKTLIAIILKKIQ
jgi:predicted AAA+ superfamily ATPase